MRSQRLIINENIQLVVIKTATYLVAGKSLELLLPSFKMKILNGFEQNEGTVIMKKIG
jgi:hypothetical protein